jgi:hypothetical protein
MGHPTRTPAMINKSIRAASKSGDPGGVWQGAARSSYRVVFARAATPPDVGWTPELVCELPVRDTSTPPIIPNPPQGADDLRVASFVTFNGVLRMRALCTVFIVTCTDGLGEHGDRDEFGTRNALAWG